MLGYPLEPRVSGALRRRKRNGEGLHGSGRAPVRRVSAQPDTKLSILQRSFPELVSTAS